MSKLLMILLAVGAFIYAAYLVLFRKELPKLGNCTGGIRKRFLLATALFAGLFYACAQDKQAQAQPKIMCYKRPAIIKDQQSGATPAVPSSSQLMQSTLKAVWLTLDPAKGEEFRIKLNEAVNRTTLKKQVADLMALAFNEVARHKEMTRGKGMKMMCYDMSQFGSAIYQTREQLLTRLELLKKAGATGQLDEETIRTAKASIAKELEMLNRVNALKKDDKLIQNELALLKEYQDGKLAPGEDTVAAAEQIVDLEKP